MKKIKLKYIQEEYTEEEFLSLIIPLNAQIEEIESFVSSIEYNAKKMKLENPKKYYSLLINAIYIEMNNKIITKVVKTQN